MQNEASTQKETINLGVYFKENSELLNLLKPLLKALNWPGYERHIYEALPHFCDTMDLTHFRNVMARLHYKSEPFNLSLQSLDVRFLPSIFIPEAAPALLVLEKMDDGFRCVSGDTLEEVRIKTDLYGVAYVFSKTDKEKPRRQNIPWFNQNLSRFSSLFKQVLFLSLVLNLFSLTIPLFVMVIYDKVIATQSYSLLFNFMLGAVIVLSGMVLLQSMRTEIVAYVGARLTKLVGDEILVRLLYLTPAAIESATVGAQIARIKDFDNIKEFFTGNLAIIIFELPFAIVFLVVIAIIGKWLVFVPICMVFLFLIFYLFLNPVVLTATEQSSQAQSIKQNFQIEALSNLRAIKTSAAESIWEHRFEENLAKSCMAEYRNAWLGAISNAISDFLMMITGLSMVFFGVLSVLDDEITAGVLIATMMLSWRVLNPIKAFFSVLPRLDQMRSSINQINHLMNIRLEHAPNDWINPISKIKGDIGFNRVSFRYQPDVAPALLGVSFNIKAGEWVCIAGRNGSGKSTLLKMIPSMYIPQAGSIFIDRANTRQTDVIELRHALAYMPQQITIFYGTILQNILLANPVASFDTIVFWAKKIGLYDEIMQLPQQFHTLLREQSAGKLSASFEQKLSLLRVLIKDANILLLDEPGNNLNSEDDKRLISLMENLKGHKTILMVTHRPGHIQKCDRVLFLEQGQLMFDGLPKDVLQKIPFGIW